jgi:GxxExxY protein
LEAVYEEALEKEFIKGYIPYRRQTLIYYKGEPLIKEFRADFICYEAIILELKAVTLIPRQSNRKFTSQHQHRFSE